MTARTFPTRVLFQPARAGFRSGRGFTLVELLIVVGIIAVLISLLLPSLTRARDASRRALCLSNLRQLQIAHATYCQDFKGTLWWASSPPFQVLLKPYFGANNKGHTINEILCCPSAPNDGRDTTAAIAAAVNPAPSPFEAYLTHSNDNGCLQSSYGMNRWLWVTNWNATPPSDVDGRYWDQWGFENHTPINFVSLANSQKFGDIPLYFDSRWRECRPHDSNWVTGTANFYYTGSEPGLEGGMSYVATKRHGQYANVAFMDGSARTVYLPDLWTLRWHPKWTKPASLPPVPW